jgi:transcriptional regulator with GAF, ATPase, and Fis domain
VITQNPQGLIREVAELVQDLQRQQHPDLGSALAEMTARAVAAMPGAQHGGVTLATRGGKVESASSTGRYPMLLDDIQQRHEEGPCLSAALEQHVVHIPDIERERRWAAYCRDALRETPIRSVMSFQLFADRNNLGALNFFAEVPQAFDADATEMGAILATHTAVVWNMVRRAEQFRSALATRDVIGQAKGMIMERFTIDADQAFELLKRLSQSSNTSLADVARQLVGSERGITPRPE